MATKNSRVRPKGKGVPRRSLVTLAMAGVLGLCAAGLEPAAARGPALPASAETPPPTHMPGPSPGGDEEVPTPVPLVASLIVKDQDASAGLVIIDEVIAPRRGFVVIYNDQDGAPGETIGAGLVLYGPNQDVSVPIDLSRATPDLYAVLHEDRGEPFVFDPTADKPITLPIEFRVELPEERSDPYLVNLTIEQVSGQGPPSRDLTLVCPDSNLCGTTVSLPSSFCGTEGPCRASAELVCEQGSCQGALTLSPCGREASCSQTMSPECQARTCSWTSSFSQPAARSAPQTYSIWVHLADPEPVSVDYVLKFRCTTESPCRGSTRLPEAVCGGAADCEVRANYECGQRACSGRLDVAPCSPEGACGLDVGPIACSIIGGEGRCVTRVSLAALGLGLSSPTSPTAPTGSFQILAVWLALLLLILQPRGGRAPVSGWLVYTDLTRKAGRG